MENETADQEKQFKKPVHLVPLNLTNEELTLLKDAFPNFQVEPGQLQKDHALDGAARDMFRRNMSSRICQNEMGLKPNFEETQILIAPSTVETRFWKKDDAFQKVHSICPDGHQVPLAYFQREGPGPIFTHWTLTAEHLAARPGDHTYCYCLLENCPHVRLIEGSKYVLMFDVHQSVSTHTIANLVLTGGVRAVLVAGHFDQPSKMRNIEAKRDARGNFEITYTIGVAGVGEYERQVYHQAMGGGPASLVCTCGFPTCDRTYPFDTCGSTLVYDRKHYIEGLDLAAYIVTRPLMRHKKIAVLSLSETSSKDLGDFTITEYGGIVEVEVKGVEVQRFLVPKRLWTLAMFTLPNSRTTSLSMEHVQREWCSANREIVGSYPVKWQYLYAAAAAFVALESQAASLALESAVGVRSVDAKLTSALATTAADNGWWGQTKKFIANSWARPFNPTRLDQVNGGSLALTFADNKTVFFGVLVSAALIKGQLQTRPRAATLSFDWSSVAQFCTDKLERTAEVAWEFSTSYITKAIRVSAQFLYELTPIAMHLIAIPITPIVRLLCYPVMKTIALDVSIIQPCHVAEWLPKLPILFIAAGAEEFVKNLLGRRFKNRYVGAVIAGGLFGMMEHQHIRAGGLEDTMPLIVRMGLHIGFSCFSHVSLLSGTLTHMFYNYLALTAAAGYRDMVHNDVYYLRHNLQGLQMMLKPWQALGAAVAAFIALRYGARLLRNEVVEEMPKFHVDVKTTTIQIPEDQARPFLVSGYCCFPALVNNLKWARQVSGLRGHPEKKGTFLYVWTKYYTQLYPGACSCNTANAIIRRWLEPRETNPKCLVTPFLPCQDEAGLQFKFIQETDWSKRYHSYYLPDVSLGRKTFKVSGFMCAWTKQFSREPRGHVDGMFEQRVYESVPMRAAFVAALKTGATYHFQHERAEAILRETGTYQRVLEAVNRNSGLTNEMSRFTSFTKIEPKGVNCLTEEGKIESKPMKTRAILNTPDSTKLDSGLCARDFMDNWKSALNFRRFTLINYLVQKIQPTHELGRAITLSDWLKRPVQRHPKNKNGTLDLDSGIRAYRSMVVVDKQQSFKFDIGCGTASGLWTTTPDNTMTAFTVTSVWISTWYSKFLGANWERILTRAQYRLSGRPYAGRTFNLCQFDTVLCTVIDALEELRPMVKPLVGDAIQNGSAVQACRDRAVFIAMLLIKLTGLNFDLMEVDTDVSSMDASTSITWQNGKNLIHRISGLIGPPPIWGDLQVALGTILSEFTMIDDNDQPKRFPTKCDCGQRAIHFGQAALPKDVENCCFQDELHWQRTAECSFFNSERTAPSQHGFQVLAKLHACLVDATPICGLGDDVKGTIPVVRLQEGPHLILPAIPDQIRNTEKVVKTLVTKIWNMAGFNITGSFEYRNLRYLEDTVAAAYDDQVAQRLYAPFYLPLSLAIDCPLKENREEEALVEVPHMLPVCDDVHSTILSAQPMPTQDGLVMSQKTGRCLARVGVCEEWRGKNSLALIKTKATAAFHNNQANPLLRLYLKRLFESIPGPLYQVPRDNPYALRIPEGLIINPDDEAAKATICRVYDISADDYENFRQYLSEVPIPGPLDHPVLTRMLVKDFA